MVQREASAGSGLGLTGCVLATGVIGGEDYEELDRYNRQGRTGRASGRGAQQSRRGSWRYKRWEDLRAARTSVHLAPPEARAVWTAGLRQALGQGPWPSGLCVPGMATGSLGVLNRVFSFLCSFNQGHHDPADWGVRGPGLGGTVQVCQEALAWQARALAGLSRGQLDRGICGTQALPQRTGLGVCRAPEPEVGGEVVLLSPQCSRLAGKAGLAPVPLAAGRPASGVRASRGEAPPQPFTSRRYSSGPGPA